MGKDFGKQSNDVIVMSPYERASVSPSVRIDSGQGSHGIHQVINEKKQTCLECLEKLQNGRKKTAKKSGCFVDVSKRIVQSSLLLRKFLPGKLIITAVNRQIAVSDSLL